ncbi:MAG: DUF1573 domain-containing protein [Ginsengibacter sp.]|jgi:hypothetical protein
MVNKIIIATLISFIFLSCNIRNNNKNGEMVALDGSGTMADTTTVQIIDSVYNFGKVTDGENVAFSFRFKNTGTKPLIIASAHASCGCTVPEKPEQPIKPGETGYLKVIFDSKGRVGPVQKEVNVISNAYPDFPVLLLTGEVVSANK